MRVGVEYTSRKKKGEIMDFKDEIDMIKYGLNLNHEVIIRRGTSWWQEEKVLDPEYVLEIYDDYRE